MEKTLVHSLKVALVAALSLCLMAFPLALGGCQQQSEPVSIIVKVPTLEMTAIDDPEVTDSYSFLVKAAEAFENSPAGQNVDIDVQHFEIARENEAVEQSFGTPNAPDVLYEGYFNMATYIHNGQVVPLDDIITPEIRGDIDQAYWDLSSLNGKTYMMPFLTLQNIMCFNEDLFRQAGLEKYIVEEDVIQSWTPEQWNEVLSTLAQNLPEGSYPMMMFAKNDQGDTHTMTLLRSQGSQFFDENGRFNLNTPEGIAGLQWLKDQYDAGAFPPHAENLEILDSLELFTDGRLGIYIYNPGFANTFGETLNLGYVNFPSADGNGYATSFVTGFEVFDNGDPAKVQAAKDFVKFIYENQEWLDYSAGDLPVSNKTAASHLDKIPMLEQWTANAPNVIDFTANNPNWRGVRDVYYVHIQDLLRGTTTAAETAAAIDADCNAAIEQGYQNSTLHE